MRRIVSVGFAVAVFVGLTAPVAASEATTSTGDLQSDVLSSTHTTMEIINGLSEVEDSASPALPPGQGGTPPGKPDGPGNLERPPEFAQNDKEKDKDKDKDEGEDQDEN